MKQGKHAVANSRLCNFHRYNSFSLKNNSCERAYLSAFKQLQSHGLQNRGLEPTNKRNIAIEQLQQISRPSFLSCRRTWKGFSAAVAHVDVLASACDCVPSFDRPRRVRRTHNRPRNRRTGRSAIRRRRKEQARRWEDCFCCRCCWCCRRCYWSCCCYRCCHCCWERVL